MKRTIVLIVALLPFFIFAQVRVITTPTKEKEKAVLYDSINNAPGYLVEGMVGQELFLPPISEGFQKYGYNGLYCYSNKERAPYEEVASHTFKVTSVAQSDNYYFDYKLDLEDINTGAHYYYSYSTIYSSSWPFITMGYKAKYEALNKGKVFVFRGPINEKDINGNEIKMEGGSIWTFQEIVAQPSFLNGLGYLFTNKENISVVFYYTKLKEMFPKSEIDKLRKRYGNAMCNVALNGKIKIGMPKDLVIIAWGEPKRINNSSYNEQWVYEDNYVYIKNGKVTGWN